ncbi:MAG: hypothetical protein JO037_18640 [Actinobacteria bacterium]|nr:hypothetical protein [Actinomycetota bacterium]
MRVPQVSERIKEVPVQALRGVFAGIGQLLLVTDRLRNKTPAGTGPPAQQAETAPTAPGPADPAPASRAPAAAEPAPASPGTAEPAPASPGAAEPAPVEAPASEPAVARTSRVRPVAVKPATPKPTAARRAPAKPGATKPATPKQPGPPKPQQPRDPDKTGNVRLLGGDERTRMTPAGAAAASPAAPVNGAAPGSGPGELAPPLPGYDEMSVPSLRARLRNLDAAQVRQLAEYERAHAGRAEVVGMFERRIAKLQAEGGTRAEADVAAEVRTAAEGEAGGKA